MSDKVPVPPGSAVITPGLLEIWPHLENRQRHVLPIMLSYWPNIFPSQTTIGERAKLTRQSVNAIVKSLVGVGMFTMSPRQDQDGGRSSNEYHLVDVENPTVRAGIIARLCPTQNLTGGSFDTGAKLTPPVKKSKTRQGVKLDTPCTPVFDTNIQAEQPKNIQEEARAGGDAPAIHSTLTGPVQGEEYEGEAPQSSAHSLPDEKAKPLNSTGQYEKPLGAVVETLTPEEAAWFVTAPANMDLYIRFGRTAAFKSLDECERFDEEEDSYFSLPSSDFDWLAYGETIYNEPLIGDWRLTHFAGFYWHLVSSWRAARGLPLTLPNWESLCRELKQLDGILDYNGKLYDYILNLTNHFDLIRFRIGLVGQSLTLDESTFINAYVRGQLREFSGQPQEWFDREYQQMQSPIASPMLEVMQ